MKKLFRNSAFYLLLLITSLVLPTCKEAPTDAPVLIAKITGKVTDAVSNAPLQGVQITTTPATVSVVTGPTGDYTIEGANPGAYKITATKTGYIDKSINISLVEGKVISADIQMMEMSPMLEVSTEQLDFDEAQNSLTFNISNKTKVGSLSWQISFNQPWLSVSPSSGTTTTESDIITVTVNRDSLAYGGFGATLTVTSTQGSKEVNVVVIKRNPSAPQLTILPTTLDFGTNLVTKSAVLKNTGTGTLNWDATSSELWLSISKISGNTVPGDPVDLVFTVNKAGLPVGNYEGVVSFTSNEGNKSVLVTMKVDIGVPPAPQLSVSPLQLDCGTNFLTKTFTLRNNGTGTLNWSAGTSDTWMSLSKTSGEILPGGTFDVNVSISRSGLNGGDYQGEVNITSNGGNRTVIVTMSVVVVTPLVPKLLVTPSTLDFGISNAPQSIKVKNTGTGTLNWSASPSKTWISLSQSSGTTAPGDSVEFNVTIIRTGLNGGNHQSDIVFTSNGGNQSVTVKMAVEAAPLPQPELQVLSTITYTSIALGWTKASALNFTSYKIFRSTTPGVSEASTLVTTVTNPESNTYTNSGLTPGTTYYYKVYAYNSSGVGTGSNEVTASTLRQFGSWNVVQDLESPYSYTSSAIYSFHAINCLHAISSSEAWYVSEYKVYHFINNGWTNIHTQNKTLTTIWMGADGRGFVGTYGWGLLRYDGISWTTETGNGAPTNYIYDITGIAMNKLWVAAGQGIYFYDGTTWQFFNLNANIRDLDFVSENEIWAVSDEGKVYKYNGIGWSYMGNPDYTVNQTMISAVSSTDVWVGFSSYEQSGLWHFNGVDFSKNYKL